MDLTGLKGKNFDDFKYPRRKPWLLLVVLLVIGLVILQHYRGKGAPKEEAEQVEPDALETVVAIEGPGQVPPPVAPIDEGERLSPEMVTRLMVRGQALERAGDLVGSRIAYARALRNAPDHKTRDEAETRLGEVNVALVTTPRKMPEKQDYVVQRGDSLERIARRFGTTVDLLQSANELANPNIIKAGDLLRVFAGKFELAVSKKRSDVVVYMNGEFFKRYLAGTGRYGKTPTGTFKLVEKQKEPVWWPQGREVPYGHPDNILGTRWMTLKATGETPDVSGYGIHGTWDESSVGKASSAGCIRLRNRDVEELYVLVPVGTPVTITE